MLRTFAQRRQGRCKSDVDEPDKGTVGMCEGEHESPSFVAHIEIPTNFEAVKCFQSGSNEGKKQQHRPPEH